MSHVPKGIDGRSRDRRNSRVTDRSSADRESLRNERPRADTHDQVAEARDAIDEASALADDATVSAQLTSVRRGTEQVDDDLGGDAAGDGPLEASEAGDRLEPAERRTVSLGDDVDGLVESHLSTARDQTDAARRESAPDREASTDTERE